MSTKRGPKPLPPDKKLCAVITVRVPATLADELFLLAHRHRTEVSAITRRYYERLILRDRETTASYK